MSQVIIFEIFMDLIPALILLQQHMTTFDSNYFYFNNYIHC
jgi:hypothetical protein